MLVQCSLHVNGKGFSTPTMYTMSAQFTVHCIDNVQCPAQWSFRCRNIAHWNVIVHCWVHLQCARYVPRVHCKSTSLLWLNPRCTLHLHGSVMVYTVRVMCTVECTASVHYKCAVHLWVHAECTTHAQSDLLNALKVVTDRAQSVCQCTPIVHRDVPSQDAVYNLKDGDRRSFFLV